MKRWPLQPGDRVYVPGFDTLAVVNRISARLMDVELYWPESFNQGPRVFMWDECIVPVDLIVAQCLGLDLVEYKAKGVPT